MNLSAQYSATDPIQTSNLLNENLGHPEESISYTKLTGENCSTESGYGLSDCGFAELHEFMAKIVYPQVAYEMNIQDKCAITFTGTKEGRTDNIIVSNCLDLFKKPIQNHLAKMTWQPVYKNGEAIDFTVTFKTVFKTEL